MLFLHAFLAINKRVSRNVAFFDTGEARYISSNQVRLVVARVLDLRLRELHSAFLSIQRYTAVMFCQRSRTEVLEVYKAMP